ncbi:MAG: aminoacyl-histidine dipeptidase [Prevotellaceae bacterium]|jgi:dipeptidase D|nr:aminoacyl-histidine dipeptidase [Prevotellaceae bacterium]
MNIQDLEPKGVFTYFAEICKIPRPSKKEEKIIAYLLDFAKEQGLEAKKDDAGNILIIKLATPEMENRKTVVLQSHMDMVCEKNDDVSFNFDTDPIQAYVDGEWVKAKGTTLGADCGIGMAAQLAILTDNNIKHGPIECLFTVDEETGLTGAAELQPGFLTGKILLNLDSEDEGEIFIGCAGGIDTIALFKHKREPIPSDYNVALKIKVRGLKGGHSGDDINKGLGNANKILNRFLWRARSKYDLRLSSLDGGNLRNAIAREATAIFTIHKDDKTELIKDLESYNNIIKNEFRVTEPSLNVSIEDCPMPDYVIDETCQFDLFNALYACPHGVLAMSQEIEGLVETSTNLASVKFVHNDQIIISTSQRSSVNTAKQDVVNMVRSVFSLANANVKSGDGYPGWTPNKNSEILKIAEKVYTSTFNTAPAVKAIHAGLECGLFLEKYSDLDMISFGPTLRGVHSPDERLNIESTQKFWLFLCNLLEEIPVK